MSKQKYVSKNKEIIRKINNTMVKLTQEEFNYVKETYEEIVIKGILNNQRLVKAYRILTSTPDEVLVNVQYARKHIFNFFTYKMEYEIVDDESIEDQLENLQEELLNLESYDENDETLNKKELSNKKRSVKMKINHLQKKLEE